MSKRSIVFALALLALLIVGVISSESLLLSIGIEKTDDPVVGQPPTTHIPVDLETRESDWFNNLASTIAGDSDCVPRDEFIYSRRAKKLDEWFLSWGVRAPTNIALNARPYVSYDVETLTVLANSGNAEAMHEIAMIKLWTAFRGSGRTPDYRSFFFVSPREFPFAEAIDYQSLEEGRSALYEAAMHGRIFALAEIGFSYSLEVIFLDKSGQLSEEKARELRLLAYSYGRAPQQLIDGLGPNFVQMRMDADSRAAAKNTARAVVSTFLKDRLSSAGANVPLPTAPDELADRIEICH